MVKRRRSKSIKIEIKEENKILQKFNKWLIKKVKSHVIATIIWISIILFSAFIIGQILVLLSNFNINYFLTITLSTTMKYNFSIFLLAFLAYGYFAVVPLRNYIFYNLSPLYISKELKRISQMEIRGFEDKVKIIEILESIDNAEVGSTNESKDQILDFSFNVLRILKEFIIHIERGITVETIQHDLLSLSNSFETYDYRGINTHTMTLLNCLQMDQDFETYEIYREYKIKSKKLSESSKYTILIGILTLIAGLIYFLINNGILTLPAF